MALTPKKKHHYEEEHGDAGHGDSESNWIMSYADMMTLLVGFFALLYSFSQIDKSKFEKIRQQVSQDFGGKFENPFEDLDEALKQLIQQREDLKDKVTIEREADQLSIIFQGSIFFDPGSVIIRVEGKQTLDEVVKILKEKAMSFPIYVEGHTDDNPIGTVQFPSNWELSSGRACSVIRVFEDFGFDRKKLSAQGFSDTRPISPNRDEQGNPIPENQGKNRRVIIRVLNK